MRTFKILNIEPEGYSEQARGILETVAEVQELPLSRHELINQLGEYDGLIVRFKHRIDRELFQASPRLKVIVSATTGLDHIDVDYATSRRIDILSLHGETEFLRGIPATAEHTWGLLLALIRRVPWSFDAVRQGEWERDAYRGNDLAGRRLGIVGLGRIGERVAKYGLAFDLSVAAYDPYRPDWVDGVRRALTLHDVAERADILTIHVPLNGETAGLISTELIRSMPSHAWLVNTSRGAVVNEMALLQALESGNLSGAALDVMSEEPPQAQGQIHQLISYARSHSNLLITPHIGGATLESMRATEVFMAEKLVRYLKEGAI